MNELKINVNILRYNHSHLLGELINVGLLVYYVQERKVDFFYIDSFDRLTLLYPDFRGTYLKQQFSFIQKKIASIDTKELYEGGKKLNILSYLEKKILPRDSSQLQFSENINVSYPKEYFIKSDFERNLIESYLVIEEQSIKRSGYTLLDKIDNRLNLWITPDEKNKITKIKKDFIYLPRKKKL
ncbi:MULTISPECIES: DUF3037 domain-containing protein [Sphingobacterium]|uniref:DUF3037 domain-containing protein n=1 Tax=Sphingobacterium TaxID=28453 RepID=UPI0025804C2C|nr:MULTISPECIES: DUF3037 domain-containing protein [Sphingobacterium]